jgi:hypothetical protein
MKTKILGLLVIFSFVFFSCQKKNDLATSDQSANLLKSATIAVNDVAIQSVALEANFETDFYAGYEHLLRQLAHFKGRKGNLLEGKKDMMHYMGGQSPVVSIDTAATGYPINISIDYGTGTATNHGRSISGVVKIEISAAKNTDGSTWKITFINCVIDSIGINGTSTETFNGDNKTTRKMTVVSNATFTLPNGTILERSGNDVREWLKGLDTTTDRTDDMIQTTGSINVKSSTSNAYSRVITEPLINLGDCRHPVSGIVTYSQNGAVIATLNYGDGTCDNLAQLTTNGTTIDIELQGKMPKADLDGKGHMGGMGNKGGKGGMGGH